MMATPMGGTRRCPGPQQLAFDPEMEPNLDMAACPRLGVGALIHKTPANKKSPNPTTIRRRLIPITPERAPKVSPRRNRRKI